MDLLIVYCVGYSVALIYLIAGQTYLEKDDWAGCMFSAVIWPIGFLAIIGVCLGKAFKERT